MIGPRLLLFHQPHLSDLGNRNITVNQIPTWNWVNNWMRILWIFIWTAFMHTFKSIKLCNKLFVILMVSPSSLWSWKKYDLRPYGLFGMCFFRLKCSMSQKNLRVKRKFKVLKKQPLLFTHKRTCGLLISFMILLIKRQLF